MIKNVVKSPSELKKSNPLNKGQEALVSATINLSGSVSISHIFILYVAGEQIRYKDALQILKPRKYQRLVCPVVVASPAQAMLQDFIIMVEKCKK